MTVKSQNPLPAFAKKPRIKLITALDFLLVFGLTVVAILAFSMPERLWRGLANALSVMGEKIMPGKARRQQALIEQTLGGQALTQSPKAIRRELDAGHIEESFQLLRCHLPGGWRPRIEIIGLNHLETAIKQGQGVILMHAFTTFCSLISKMALDQYGYRIAHLSHPRHGFSDSRFGIALINPIRTMIEARFLEERVVMTPDNPVAAMRRLRSRLKEGGIVSFMAREMARFPVETSFLGGTIWLASGAVDLSYVSKAPLLPAFTAQHSDGGYRLVIDAPLEIPKDLPRNEASLQMLKAYAASLEPHVRHYPGQWRGWQQALKAH